MTAFVKRRYYLLGLLLGAALAIATFGLNAALGALLVLGFFWLLIKLLFYTNLPTRTPPGAS